MNKIYEKLSLSKTPLLLDENALLRRICIKNKWSVCHLPAYLLGYAYVPCGKRSTRSFSTSLDSMPTSFLILSTSRIGLPCLCKEDGTSCSGYLDFAARSLAGYSQASSPSPFCWNRTIYPIIPGALLCTVLWPAMNILVIRQLRLTPDFYELLLILALY